MIEFQSEYVHDEFFDVVAVHGLPRTALKNKYPYLTVCVQQLHLSQWESIYSVIEKQNSRKSAKLVVHLRNPE